MNDHMPLWAESGFHTTPNAGICKEISAIFSARACDIPDVIMVAPVADITYCTRTRFGAHTNFGEYHVG